MGLTIYLGGQSGTTASDLIGQSTKEKRKGSIDARNFQLNGEENPLIAQKRQSARKQAMKLIGDAWKRDEKSSQQVKAMQDAKAQTAEELQQWKSKLNGIDEKRKFLQEEYGVDPNSQEQKDLELLIKYQDNKSGTLYEDFSEEEIERLKELQNTPLTEYQKMAIQVNATKDYYMQEKDRCESSLRAMTASITDAKIEQLKSQDMEKNKEAADAVLEAANQDILGILMQEGKDKIDEDQKEQQEKVEKAQEEKKEQEEKIEKAKEDKQENEETQEEIIEGEQERKQLEQDASLNQTQTDHLTQAQQKIQKIMQKNQLVNEDIKGIEIDLNF